MRNRYVVLGIFSMMILGCNIIPVNNTPSDNKSSVTKKGFSTSASNVALKLIPPFAFKEVHGLGSMKPQASLSADMIQSDFINIETSFTYSDEPGLFFSSSDFYYKIDNREINLNGVFRAGFNEKPKSYVPENVAKGAYGIPGTYTHRGEITINGTISGKPNALNVNLDSSFLDKESDIFNQTGCPYTHFNRLYGGSFSGSSFIVGNDINISGSLSGTGTAGISGFCSWHPFQEKSISANFSLKYKVPTPPVKVEVKPNKEKTKFYRTKGNNTEKIRIEVTALSDTRWRLSINGKDENGNDRTYYKDGSGNEDLDWDGKTNDAVNPEEDTYFADSYNGTYAIPLKVDLISDERKTSADYIRIDNTPPDIAITKIEGNVIKGVINDVSEIDDASLPKDFIDGDKRISITYSDNPDPATYQDPLYQEPSKLNSKIFEATVTSFFPDEPRIMEFAEYNVSGLLEDELKDKLSNQYFELAGILKNNDELNVNPFSTEATGLQTKPVSGSVTKQTTTFSNKSSVSKFSPINYTRVNAVTNAALKKAREANCIGNFSRFQEQNALGFGGILDLSINYNIGTGKKLTLSPIIGVCDPLNYNSFNVDANLFIMKIKDGHELYRVNLLPYQGVFSADNAGEIHLDKREWFGSIRKNKQYAPSGKTSILDSYRTSPNIINNLFAGPPFAINDSDGEYHQIVLEIKSLTNAVTHTNAKQQEDVKIF